MHTRCAYCGGKFGLIRQRWFKNQFCSRRCREKFLAKLLQDRDRVQRWLDFLRVGTLIARHKEFRDWYISARDFQAEGLGEEMLEIARDTSGDNLARSGDNLARARLRMNALERQAARMTPRKYGIRR
jgi:hypothetical protein